MPILPKPKRLTKQLGLFDVYAIGTGPMFSSGFFLLPGLAAAQTGPSVVLAYLAAGLLMLPAACSLAELGSAMPRAGGPYYFLDRSLGPLVGTVGGLGTWLALVLKSAFALIGMGAYLALFVDVPVRPLAVGLTALFAVINILGARETAGLQRVLVITLLAILAYFVVEGIGAVAGGDGPFPRDRFSPLLPYGMDAFLGTVGLVSVSFAGLLKVASVSEEVRDPDRNISLGMILSLATATVVYVLGVYVVVAVIEPARLAGDLTPVATAAGIYLDRFGAATGVVLMVVAAVAGFAATSNAGIMSASRFPLAAARDGLLPDVFARISRLGTPIPGILLAAIAMIAFIVLFDVGAVAKLASTTLLVVLQMINLAVIVMRESRIEAYDPGYRSPFYPWMQILGLFVPFWLITEMGALPILFTVAMVTAGLWWFSYYGRRRVARGGAIYHVFERLGRQRFEGLDRELRTILKEKGVREEDLFDELVARAHVIDLPAEASFEDAVRQACARLAERLPAVCDELAEGFLRGTRLGATPVARGAALPHLRLPHLAASHLTLARSRAGIGAVGGDNSGGEGRPAEAIHALFFLVSPAEKPGQHLRILAQIARRVDEEEFMGQWLAAAGEQELKEALLREERFLSLRLARAAFTARLIGRMVRDLPMPPGTLIAMVRRGEETIVPRGATVLEEGDRLTIIGDPGGIRLLRQRYEDEVDVRGA